MKLRTHIKSKRSLLTSTGTVTFSRYILIPSDKDSAETLLRLNGQKTIAPLDEMLHIDQLPFKMTVAAMLIVAWYGVKAASYEEAADLINQVYSEQAVNVSTVREVTNYIGKMVYLNDCTHARRAKWEYENCQIDMNVTDDDVLYIMTDGAALNTRTKVQSSDGSETSWKENKLCVVFRSRDIRSWKHTTSDGMSEARHKILRREYISYTGSIEEFKWHVLALALRNGYGKVKKVVIISDGATWISNLKKELFPEAIKILDLFHLKENTYAYSKAIFSDDQSKAATWAKETCSLLEDGKWEYVLKDLQRFKNIHLPEGTVDLALYIDNHKDNLDYPEYKKQGFFVGSGMIESANKIVLQKRLKGPGMRWNVPTARYVLALRAKIESGMWGEVICFIRHKLLIEGNIPSRLPRDAAKIIEQENQEIENSMQNEKLTWRKKRKRS